MPSFSYTAKRKIMSGHTAGFSYEFDQPVITADVTTDATTYDNISLGGVTQTYLSRVDYGYRISTSYVDEGSAEHMQLVEFLNSVIAKESFLFDRFGSVADPDDPVLCELKSKTLTEGRQSTNSVINFSFDIRLKVVPA